MLALIAAAFIALLPFIGMETIGIAQLFSDALQKEIFLTLRLPRVLIAFAAGGGLAVCGLVFQGIFRNPMADPFTLGVASGASFGAALTILTGITGAFLGIPIITLGALCGAALSFILVITFSSTTRSTSSNTILLAGIAASFFFSSLLMFSQYLSDMRGTFRIVRWLMGGVEVFGYGSLLSILPFIVIGLILITANAAALDHFLAGEDIAQTRGIRVRRSRNLLLFSATIIVGGIVSVCGPIGFVGLMIPHFCRRLFGASHKILLPACLLSGGIFLMICDAFARTIAAPTDIPVGVITALLGGPFLVWILRRYRY
jgi:iron complex transport system permease protein